MKITFFGIRIAKKTRFFCNAISKFFKMFYIDDMGTGESALNFWYPEFCDFKNRAPARAKFGVLENHKKIGEKID